MKYIILLATFIVSWHTFAQVPIVNLNLDNQKLDSILPFDQNFNIKIITSNNHKFDQLKITFLKVNAPSFISCIKKYNKELSDSVNLGSLIPFRHTLRYNSVYTIRLSGIRYPSEEEKAELKIGLLERIYKSDTLNNFIKLCGKEPSGWAIDQIINIYYTMALNYFVEKGYSFKKEKKVLIKDLFYKYIPNFRKFFVN